MTWHEDPRLLSRQDVWETADAAWLLIQLDTVQAWRLVRWHYTFRGEAQPWGIGHLVLIRTLVLSYLRYFPNSGSRTRVP